MVRRFTYTIASDRYDKIDIEEKIGSTWYLYRKIDFTYHENVRGWSMRERCKQEGGGLA